MNKTKCITCNKNANGLWFCPYHTEVKKKAYAKAKDLGLNNWLDVATLRDKILYE